MYTPTTMYASSNVLRMSPAVCATSSPHVSVTRCSSSSNHNPYAAAPPTPPFPVSNGCTPVVRPTLSPLDQGFLEENEWVYALTEEEVDTMLTTRSNQGSSSTCQSAGACSDGGEECCSRSLLCASDARSSASSLKGEPDLGLARSDVVGMDEEDEPCPCTHNKWDNLRAKRDSVTLRCRVCHSQWKTGALRHQKCRFFTKDNCPQGDACTHVHVYRFKLAPKKRRAARVAALAAKSGAAAALVESDDEIAAV
eukprot:Rhum_TRINITY_DN14767_c20_g1::Rhum_TRINITY_DN14767_c20_g1_i1::g.116949::m.116949